MPMACVGIVRGDVVPMFVLRSKPKPTGQEDVEYGQEGGENDRCIGVASTLIVR